MLILSTLSYISIGATIFSWDSLVPVVVGDVVNAQTANHTNVQRKLGVNCRGNPDCYYPDWKGPRPPQILTAFINQLSDDTWYKNGHQIACTNNGICAFLQYMPTASGKHSKDNQEGGAYVKDIKEAAQHIVDHNCQMCGSFPMIDGDVKHGELTFNRVDNPCSLTLSVDCICDSSGTQCAPITITTTVLTTILTAMPISIPTTLPITIPTTTTTTPATTTTTTTQRGNGDLCKV